MPVSDSTLEDIYEDALTGLTIGQPPIGAEGAKELAAALAENSSLKTLNIDNHALGDEGIALIAKALEKNSNLQELNLRNNNISPEGAKTLAKAVAGHPSLNSLNIGANPLGDEGAAHIMEALKGGAALRYLFLDKTDLTAEGGKTIAAALREGSELTCLNVSHNGMAPEGSLSIAKSLEENSSLISLYIAGNTTSDETVSRISNTIRSSGNQNLLHVTLVKVDDELQQMLKRNHETAKALAHRFQWNKTDLSPEELRQIDVRLPVIANVIDVDVAAVRESFDIVISKIPKLSAAENLPDSLFKAGHGNYAPLDNPRLWRNAEEAKQILDNVPLTKEFLAKETPRGTVFLDALANALPAAEFMEALNHRGVKFGAEELLDGEGKPNALMTTLLEKKGGAEALFSLSNWLGKPVSELLQVHKALPEGSPSIALHGLRQEMGKTARSQSVGR